jgi:branched-chain amino acid aminotransferase
MEMEPLIYLNGQLVPADQARVSVLDYGFLFGYAVFETMRAYGGAIFKLDRHLERMAGSAEALALPLSKSEWGKAACSVVEANRLQEARVRLVLSAGEGTLTPDVKSCARPTLLAIAVPYNPPGAEIFQRGYRMIISSIHRNSQSPLPGFKTSNFLESLLARQEARRLGVEDALMLNDSGFLAEASSSNVFDLKNGRLKTPRPGSGILPGITRSLILELANNLEIKVEETEISPAELLEADEVFISNSMIEIMPVAEINGRWIGAGKPGPITRRLSGAYKKLTQES